MHSLIQFRSTILPLVITVVLACFAISPMARAVVPAPDGGYPGGNTAEGQNALLSLTTGVHNTAIGYLSLKGNITGGYNTAVGSGTLLRSIADGNTATGTFALLSNTSGGFNTANGTLALFSDTEGIVNNAVGYRALYSNTAGGGNNAFGFVALQNNTTGDNNAAFGGGALSNLTSGNDNTAVGGTAGLGLNVGSGNVYIGEDVVGQTSESNHTYIRNINATTVSGGGTDTVTVNLSTGLLGHLSSSRRYKQDIKPMASASETLHRLKPVTYRYKKEIDPSQSLNYGLVAEDVARIDPNLANRNRDGQIESVRYHAINAMLLNEFLKEHRIVQEQKATIAELKSTVEKQEATNAQQQKQIKALTAGLEKVSAQLEMNKAPRVVENTY
jgi:uncharacterized coiled-coil protein SlyX